MTKEEAIEFGNMWLQMNEDCKDSNTYAFFKIAIEAIEQVSSEELDFVQPHKKIPVKLAVAKIYGKKKIIVKCNTEREL